MGTDSKGIPKEVLVRLSEDDETAFEYIYWNYNFTVDLYWKDNNLTKAVVYSGSGVPCSIYYKGEKLEFQTNAGCSYCIENDNGRLILK